MDRGDRGPLDRPFWSCCNRIVLGSYRQDHPITRIAAAMLATAAFTPSSAEKLQVPTDHPIGILKASLQEESECPRASVAATPQKREYLGAAIGEIELPPGRRLCLQVTGIACARLAGLHLDRPTPITELEIDGLGAPSPPGDSALRATVAAFPKIARLTLRNSAISNPGLAALADLPCLRQLYLHMPGLDDTGLAHIARLRDLTHLNISGGGTVTPDGWALLAHMTNLEDFALHQRMLPIGLPSALAALPRLRRFSSNALDIGPAPLEVLAKCPVLEALSLRETGTSEEIKRIGRISGLRELFLGWVRTDADLSPIAQLAKLRSLRLSGPIADKTLLTLGPLPNLETFSVDDGASFGGGPSPEARATDRSLEHIGRMTGLREVIVYHAGPFTDSGISCIASLPGIRSLMMANGHGLTDESARILARVPTLQSICLRGETITDATPRALAALRDLKSLRLFVPYSISDASLAAIGSITSLEDLEIYSTNITRAGACHLAKLSRLRDLDLGRLQDTDGPPLDLGQCTDLENLELVGASDGDLAALAHHPTLSHLSVQGPISGQGLRHVGSLPRLHSLSISGETRLTDADLTALTRLRRLAHLNLQGNFTPAGIKALSPLQGLLTISVGPNSIEPAERDQLRDLFPCLQYLTAPTSKATGP
ncbi:MAG: hypothetical protein IT577_17750 [Verrucomicrobiae bacterium]|nr:hypothetical protein [Verrucomicrobiae bacterium]